MERYKFRRWYLRNSDDIENYWNYLSANAEAAGTSPEYLGVKDASQLNRVCWLIRIWVAY